MKCVYWNIRGLGNDRARAHLRLLVNEIKPDFLCLAEPKIPVERCPSRYFSRIGLHPNVIANRREDGAANLWFLWREGLPEPVVILSSSQHMTLQVKIQGVKSFVSVVHASCLRAVRRDLWCDLASVAGVACPWLVIGDFNAYLYASEKRGPGHFNQGSVEDFTAMVDLASLTPIPSSGKKFTWSNNRRIGNVQAVLDRSFGNDAWWQQFEGCSQRVLVSGYSDHSPILVSCENLPRPPNVPFRFQRFWTKHDDFRSFVKDSWGEPVKGSPLFVVTKKLKRLKGPLRAWARGAFPHIDHEISRTKDHLHSIQKTIEEDGYSDALFDSEVSAKLSYNKAVELQEKLWKEKARDKWVKHSDRRTKYFHLSTKIRRALNAIREIKRDDGVSLKETSSIADYFVSHFESFYKRGTVSSNADLIADIPPPDHCI
ncbi:uncharacterized protein LOC122655403 [Telopea speciosissima]|uniref:uncharacterized protein LOC122655403 n=1 Tax=Telopea speciosissima TaxID=54955 RepID=UPI001CC4369D|nr:uncharacterized protein LOC122655403 [Telopea speciosissima]